MHALASRPLFCSCVVFLLPFALAHWLLLLLWPRVSQCCGGGEGGADAGGGGRGGRGGRGGGNAQPRSSSRPPPPLAAAGSSRREGSQRAARFTSKRTRRKSRALAAAAAVRAAKAGSGAFGMMRKRSTWGFSGIANAAASAISTVGTAFGIQPPPAVPETAAPPTLRPLPAALIFPNLEVMLFGFFACG